MSLGGELKHVMGEAKGKAAWGCLGPAPLLTFHFLLSSLSQLLQKRGDAFLGGLKRPLANNVFSALAEPLAKFKKGHASS